MFHDFFSPELDTASRYNKKSYKEAITTATTNMTLDGIKFCDSMKRVGSSTEWFKVCLKGFTLDGKEKDNPEEILDSINSESNVFLPIIINPCHIQQRNSVLFLSGFIKVNTATVETHSTSIPSEDKDKNIRFEIVDCNKLPITKLHLDKCSGLDRVFRNNMDLCLYL